MRANPKDSLERLFSDLPKDPFQAYEYLDADCIGEYRKVRVVFPAAFTLHALASVSHPKLKDYKERLIKALKSEIDRDSCNYWQRSSKDATAEPLPDDIDDTAAVATALIKAKQVVSPRTVIKLTQVEQSPGGPYYTWFVLGEERWKDVDPVVNAHVFYWSAAVGIKLPKLKNYILQCIKDRKTISPYYHEKIMFWFYLCRYLSLVDDSDLKPAAVKFVKKADQGNLLVQLCRSYLGLKVELPKIKIKPLALCFGFPTTEGQPTYCGSEACYLALMIELYSRHLPKDKNLFENEIIEASKQKYFAQIYPPQDSFVSLKLLHLLIKLLEVNKLTAYQKNLGLLIHYSWLNYNLLDSLIDREIDSRSALALQELNELIFWQLKKLPTLADAVLAQFAELNKFYFAEAKGIKYSDFEYIKKRQAPFIWALETFMKSTNAHLKTIKTISKILNNVLLVSQLSDDAHDYQSDIDAGISTYVTYLYKKTPDFWEKVMPRVIKIVAKLDQETSQLIKSLERSVETFLLEQLWQKACLPITHARLEIESSKEVLGFFKK